MIRDLEKALANKDIAAASNIIMDVEYGKMRSGDAVAKGELHKLDSLEKLYLAMVCTKLVK